MLKNSTPREISIRTAVYIGLATEAVLLLLMALPAVPFSWWLALCLAPAAAAISYGIVLATLDHYIYRKIKLIYKTIHNQKVGHDVKREGIDPDQPIIEEVEQEVAEWAENQQEQIDQYERFAEYRRRYVGDISHELKTPIFNIQGYLHTLMDHGYEDKKITKSFIKKAAKNVERLQTIVEDLSAISRLEAGDLMFDPEPFDIKGLAQEVIEEVDLKAREAGITLGFKEGAGQGFIVEADRESIRQVLINLVTNSIKYGNQGGATRFGFYDMDTYILCEVSDNGIGIPEKHLPHVFDRFYRVDKSRSRQKGGSGLGLSIVKHIMEAHQQTINVRSTAGLGSTFGITLGKA
ncbi:Adaptive-response sensory-kinase SasA [Neolewinella maritima]|uniref:histidine kinase n=2 Tax=Neolewinella maritima TaxID=1383882 RepID=A0ABM9B4P5_9BACT|nr:Adaptive-response sensory-kinase SasA [Neolewinella maritima]